jgi:hypothetical protein
MQVQYALEETTVATHVHVRRFSYRMIWQSQSAGIDSEKDPSQIELRTTACHSDFQRVLGRHVS